VPRPLSAKTLETLVTHIFHKPNLAESTDEHRWVLAIGAPNVEPSQDEGGADEHRDRQAARRSCRRLTTAATGCSAYAPDRADGTSDTQVITLTLANDNLATPTRT
jgi:hypothetical protein